MSEQDVQDASRQVDAARGEAVAASSERSSVLADAFTKGVAKLRSSRSSTGSASSSVEQHGETLNRLDQISRSVADSTGLTQSQVARIALGASGHLGVHTPIAGLSGNATVPTAFGDIQAQHLRNASAPELERDLAGRHQSNQGDVRWFGGGSPPPAPVTRTPSTVRGAVQEEGDLIRTNTSADQGAFDRKAQITRRRMAFWRPSAP